MVRPMISKLMHINQLQSLFEHTIFLETRDYVVCVSLYFSSVLLLSYELSLLLICPRYCAVVHLLLYLAILATTSSPLSPVGHIWDVILVWRKGNINKNCLCATVLCTVIMVHTNTSSSCRSVDSFGLWSCLVYLCLPSASVSSVLMVL